MTDTALDRVAQRDVRGHSLSLNVTGTPEPVSRSFTRRAGHATVVDDPAGGLSSTVDDLHRFAIWLGGGGGLADAWIDRMATPTGKARLADYGLGWESLQQLGERVMQHGGAMPGFSSCLAFYPEKDLYVIVLANVQEMVACEYIGRDLAAITLGRPHHRPLAPAPDVDVSTASLRRLTGVYRPQATLGSEASMGDEVVTIRARRSTLLMRGLAFLAPPYAQATALRPFSQHRFFNPQDPHVRVSFRRSEDGMNLIVHRPPYKRLRAMEEVFVRPNPRDLSTRHPQRAVA